jgi:hypothetical protein
MSELRETLTPRQQRTYAFLSPKAVLGVFAEEA